jgi:glutamate-5-semialdehyde dehydrogenase
MSIREEIIEQAKLAKKASYKLSNITTDDKNRALMMVAEGLENNTGMILKENEKDLKKAKEENMSKAFIDRLSLSRQRIEQMAQGVREVADLDDPVGDIIEMKKINSKKNKSY